MVLGLLGILVICIVALILVLPHQGATGAGKQASKQTTQPVSVANIVSPTTTINPFLPNNQTTTTNTTTTITTSSPYNSTSSSNSTSQYIQNLLNPYYAPTTTVLYEYCIGSASPPFNQSYYSQLNQSGIEGWNGTTNYPAPFSGGTCTSTGGNVYCLGNSDVLFRSMAKAAYYAPLSISGIGGWTQTTNYPVQFSSGSCAAEGSYIYCIGTMNQSNSKDVFYAPLSGSGIGAWTQTTSYPAQFYGGECSAYNGYIYCTGDAYTNASASEAYLKDLISEAETNTIGKAGVYPNVSTSYNYYAPVSASGVGPWKTIRPTPVPVSGGTCTISNSTMYCIGAFSSTYQGIASLVDNASVNRYSFNATNFLSHIENASPVAFYAHLNADGSVGLWNATSAYSSQAQGTQCVSSGTGIYCIGGGSNADSTQDVFYANVSQTGIQDWQKNATSYPIQPFTPGYCATDANN